MLMCKIVERSTKKSKVLVIYIYIYRLVCFKLLYFESMVLEIT